MYFWTTSSLLLFIQFNRCDAGAFNPSKSQKKVLKKMTKFLTVAESGMPIMIIFRLHKIMIDP